MVITEAKLTLTLPNATEDVVFYAVLVTLSNISKAETVKLVELSLESSTGRDTDGCDSCTMEVATAEMRLSLTLEITESSS